MITPLNDDLNIIAALDDEPNDEGGLSAAQFKAKFDEGPNAIKDYINDTLIPNVGADITAAVAAAEIQSGNISAGGTAGQVLVKNSGVDYDYGWGTSVADPVNAGDIANKGYVDGAVAAVPSYYVKLLSIATESTATSVNVDLSGIDMDDYESILVYANIFSNTQGVIVATINNLTTAYYGQYSNSAGTAVYSINNTANVSIGVILPSDATTSFMTPFKLEVKPSYGDMGSTNTQGFILINFCGGTSYSITDGMRNGFAGRVMTEKLSSIQLTHNQGNYILSESKFSVYGVKK